MSVAVLRCALLRLSDAVLCCAVLCCAVLCCATMFVPATVHLTPCLIQDASRGLGQQLRSSFALPSSSSPPKLYQRSPHLVQIYGNESEEEEEEADEADR